MVSEVNYFYTHIVTAIRFLVLISIYTWDNIININQHLHYFHQLLLFSTVIIVIIMTLNLSTLLFKIYLKYRRNYWHSFFVKYLVAGFNLTCISSCFFVCIIFFIPHRNISPCLILEYDICHLWLPFYNTSSSGFRRPST